MKASKLIAISAVLLISTAHAQDSIFYCVYVEKVLQYGYTIQQLEDMGIKHLNKDRTQPRMITRILTPGPTMYRGLVICSTSTQLNNRLAIAEGLGVIKKIHTRTEVNGQPVITNYNPLPDNYYTGISSGT